MKRTFEKKQVSTVEGLRALSLEAGAKLIGCQMAMDVFGFKLEDFIPGVEIAGAAGFLALQPTPTSDSSSRRGSSFFESRAKAASRVHSSAEAASCRPLTLSRQPVRRSCVPLTLR